MRPPATGMIIAPARMDQFASAAARSLASTGWPGRGGGRPETADSASSAATVTRTTKYSSLGLPGDSHGGGYSVQPCQCQWLLSSLKFEQEIERASDQAAAVATEQPELECCQAAAAVRPCRLVRQYRTCTRHQQRPIIRFQQWTPPDLKLESP